MSKPTFVLVHGAWHDPGHWGPLAKVLNSHGYKTITPKLPSVIDPDVADVKIIQSQDPDISAVRMAILHELNHGSNVIVVPHSYGGTPTSSALRDLGQEARSAAGFSTYVEAIAGIATWLLPEGMDQNQDQPVSVGSNMHEVRDTLLYVKTDPGHWKGFYGDMSREEADKWTALTKPACSLFALIQPSGYTAYEHIPVHYLRCSKDAAMLPLEQDLVINRIKANAKAKIRVEEIDSAHSPFLSRVEDTAIFLRRAAGEEIP